MEEDWENMDWENVDWENVDWESFWSWYWNNIGCDGTRPTSRCLRPFFNLAVPNILLSFQIILLDSFIISHYLKDRKSFVPMMFIMISCVDIITGVGVIGQYTVISLFVNSHVSSDAVFWAIIVTYPVVMLSYVTSVFGILQRGYSGISHH